MFKTCFALLSITAMAHAGDAKVELFNEMIGPLMKTESIRLMPDGRVVQEQYDFTVDHPDPHSEAVLCSHSSGNLDKVLAQATAVAEKLPHVIDEGSSIPIDGPKQSILVRAAVPLRSVWYSPNDQKPSRQARQFTRAWQNIKGLLVSCNGS